MLNIKTLCVSKIAALNKDETLLKSFSEVIYVDDLASGTTLTDSKLFASLVTAAKLDAFASNECPLAFPYVIVESNTSAGSNETKLTYDIGDNL